MKLEDLADRISVLPDDMTNEIVDVLEGIADCSLLAELIRGITCT